MKLLPYPKYKSSGIEWLGDVPEHWEVKRLRHVLSRNDGGVWGEEDDPEGTIVLRSTEQTVDGRWQISDPAKRNLTPKEKSVALLKVGDLVVTKSSGSALHIGKTSLVSKEVSEMQPCYSNFMQRLRVASSFDPRLVFYLLNSPTGRQQLVFNSNTTTGLANLSSGVLGCVFISSPPTAEQRDIASFLDRETGRIDNLIAKKRELLERLKEKRNALISNTVTCGLDPSAPLKSSGVDWLGDIPKHWEVAQLRRKAYILDCKHRTVPFVDDGIPLASIREVHGFRVDLANAKQTSEEEYLTLIEGDRRPRVGDIIYSRNATVGDAALVTTNERFCMGQDVCLIRAPKHHSRFLIYLFRSPPLMEQVDSLMIGSTFRRINVGQIHAFWICLPPLPEQVAIAAYLDKETAKLDALVAKVEEAVERLLEYRTALITAAVTGKIDVRKVGKACIA